MAENLTRLPALYDGCFHEIAFSRSSVSRTGLRGPRKLDQFNEEAVEARKDIHHVLRSWACATAERLGMPLPEGSVGALVAFLVSHLDWLTSFAAAPDFAAEVAGLCSRAERVTRSAIATTPQHDLGSCVKPGCDGRLTARAVPGRSAASTIGCGRGHTWRPQEWLTLSARLDEGETS
ncbi:hypothetical protein ACQ86D_01415 [Streptomyces galilaeus]